MSSILKYILDLGPSVFLPIVMILLGFIIKMKPKKAIISGLTLGIAFTGMNIILGFMFDSISPAAGDFVKNTGIQLNAIDVGWSPMSAIAWAWPYALTIFPIQIVINLVMLGFGWTNTLNVDLWNVWGKILTATIVSSVTGSIILGIIAAAIQVVVELKNSDLTQLPIYNLTKIPGVACPHMMTLQAVILVPLNRLLDFIPGLNKGKVNAAKLKEKIGVFGENSVMGFIVGGLIAGFAGYGLKGILTTAVQVSTSLVLFPMVAKLFMQALAPIADSTSSYMKNKFKSRTFYIGLDWPFMAGISEVWVAAIILVPIELGLAILLAKMGLNNVLPLGAIVNLSVVVPALIVTGGNLIRMIILGTIVTPIYLIVATNFSTMLTKLAASVGTIKVPAGQLLSWFGIESPTFRWSIAHAFNIVNGDVKGLILFLVWLVLFMVYVKFMKNMNKTIIKNNGVNLDQ